MADYSDIDLTKAARILAYRAVDQKDPDYVYRFIMRWYSREFFVPLPKVEALPVEEVLQHFFEVRYESMSEEDLEEEALHLRETKAERELREREEETKRVDDDAFFKLVQEEAKASAATRLDKPPDVNDAPIVPVAIMGQNLPTTFTELAKKDAQIRPLAPDIKMTFISESELDELNAWDLLGDPKKEKK